MAPNKVLESFILEFFRFWTFDSLDSILYTWPCLDVDESLEVAGCDRFMIGNLLQYEQASEMWKVAWL